MKGYFVFNTNDIKFDQFVPQKILAKCEYHINDSGEYQFDSIREMLRVPGKYRLFQVENPENVSYNNGDQKLPDYIKDDKSAILWVTL